MRIKLLMCLPILLSFLLNACTTMRPVTTNNASSHDASQLTVEELKVGDRVSLTTNDGVTHMLTVVEVNEEVLRGTDCEDCSPIAIPVSSIDSLHVERVSAVKSAGASVGVILTVILVLALISGPVFPPGP